MNTVIGDPEPPSPKRAAFLSLQLCSLASAAASGPSPNSYHYAIVCALKVSVRIWDVFGHFINLVKIPLLPLRENTFTII